MFKNYFKVIVRSFTKNKTFSFINITGLTIGLTSCLLITLYIQHQLSFDDFEKNGNRIARVIMEYSFEGSDATNKGNFTSVRVAPVLKKNFPEVESAVRMFQSSEIVHYKDKLIKENQFMYADPSFFNIFRFDLLKGNKNTALSQPKDVILTTSSAKKYFGDEDPLGKTIYVSGDTNLYKVTGVMPDCPKNSQVRFDFLASFSSLGSTTYQEQSYWDANYTTYLLLHDQTSINSLQAKLPSFMKKEMEDKHATVNFFLEPFNTIHLHSPYDAFTPNISITYIYILAAVALLILLIACFTYINLSTARSVERAKEVGIRKVSGAKQSQIFWQFIGESAVVSCIAVLLAFICGALLLPYFNELTNQTLQLSSLFSLPVIVIAVSIIIAVSFAAGSYPAIILSSFQPTKVLKGSFKNAASGQWLRRSLIIFQFAISVFLIVSTFIIQQQLHFIQHKKLGYDRDHVVVLPVDYNFDKDVLFKNELKQNANVLDISRCQNLPTDIHGGYNMRTSLMPQNSQIAVIANPVDKDFVPATGIQLLSGKNFSLQDEKDAADTNDNTRKYHFLLNQSAVKQLGWTAQSAIGQKMFLDDSRPGYVSGVIKDFNFQSLHNAIKPMVLFTGNGGSYIIIKISGRNIPATISFIESKWKEMIPDRPFEYRFLDDDYNKLYQNEIRLGRLMNIFASIAIILACIGLFGLSAYSAQQRIKEIGVRKVLGATVGNIVYVLSKDFIKLAGIATIIAFPVAWWATHNWLQNYEYRINVEWWIFIATAVLTILIALITVSFQAIKAAMANPVKSLRSE